MKRKLIVYTTLATLGATAGVYGVYNYYFADPDFAKWYADAITCYDDGSDNFFNLVVDQETQTVALNWNAHWNPHAQIKPKPANFRSDGSVTWLESCHTLWRQENLEECLISAVTYHPRTELLIAINIYAMNEDADRVTQLGTGVIETMTYGCNLYDDPLSMRIENFSQSEKLINTTTFKALADRKH